MKFCHIEHFFLTHEHQWHFPIFLSLFHDNLHTANSSTRLQLLIYTCSCPQMIHTATGYHLS